MARSGRRDPPPDVEDLSPAKRALLQRFLGDRVPPGNVTSEIPLVPPGGPSVLSFNQGRQWFLEHLFPGSAAYNVSGAVRLTGPIDVEVLADALQAVVERHDILRTRFFEIDGAPMQEVIEGGDVRLEFEDLTSRMSPDSEVVESSIRQAANRPFSLSGGPLFRIILFRVGEGEYVLLRVMNHIISDAWSGRILLRDLGDAYTALLSGSDLTWRPLRLRYADFAAWQRTELNRSDEARRQLNFWRDALSGSPRALSIASDRQRPALQDYRSADYSIAIPTALVSALTDFASGLAATPFMASLAAYAWLLGLYASDQHVVVGIPVAGRQIRGLEDMVGYFANSLPLRIDLAGDPSYREMLQRVKKTAIDALANQDVPFEKIVEVSNPLRDLGVAPVFQTMFQFQNFPVSPPRFAGARTARHPVEKTESAFDISFRIEPRAEAWELEIWYSRALFDEGTIERMARHYIAILDGACRAPDVGLSRIRLADEQETTRTVRQWNTTRTDYPRDATIHGLFEEQVGQGADRPALKCGDEVLTYGALNERANEVACRLLELGLGRESVVGIFARREVESIVALLGILKAGCAYLPLDPEDPPFRLQFILGDSGAGAVLSRGTPDTAAIPPGVTLIDLDTVRAGSRAAATTVAGSGGDLAGILYTSGSTGKPKGVEVLHRNVVRVVRGWDAFGFPAERIYSHLSSLWFDGSVYEIWGALLNGGCCVVNPERIPTADQLRRFFGENNITTTYLVSSFFNFVATDCPEALAGVREIITGGETMSPTHLDEVLVAAPQARVFNTYGPTECGTSATAYEVTVRRWAEDQSVPIGKPLSNTVTYIVDAAGYLCPVGVPGELYVGGDGVGRGYRGRPELTERAFVPDRFSKAGGTIYKTGDRCRYLEDGNIAFLGRTDGQVKIRGFRIELGEIEATLAAAPQVKRAVVVVAGDDGPAGPAIVAYVVPRDGEAASGTALRQFVADRLPGHMVPTAFVTIAELPLTAAGKIDRRDLPAAEVRHRSAGCRVPAIGALEEHLVAVWEKVLGVKHPGVDENFFDLGGNSLLAMRLVAEVERATGHAPALRSLFQSPTIRGFASVLRPTGVEE